MADVVLLDGRTVSTDSEAWRIETLEREKEARAILQLGTREDRRAEIDAYERRHGAEARRRLEAVIMALWKMRQAAG